MSFLKRFFNKEECLDDSMHTLTFLNNGLVRDCLGVVVRLDELNRNLGIEFNLFHVGEYYEKIDPMAVLEKSFDECFIILNYSQINSPKEHEIVKECRSLLLSWERKKEKFSVVSRSFDRFFNYGETSENFTIVDENLHCYEKVDGSLISVCKNPFNDEWIYRTKSMLMPNLSINGGLVRWDTLIEDYIMTDFPHPKSLKCVEDDVTYIFEIVSPHNRIVTRYDESMGYFLAARRVDGEYVLNSPVADFYCKPEIFKFDTIEHCMDVVKKLPNLQEGYVMYDGIGQPRCKIKSPAYLAAHRLRGETNPTPKRIIDMILINEQDEYLTIFPEDEILFQPFLEAYQRCKLDFENTWDSYKGVNDQKTFANKVVSKPCSGMLFSKKKNPSLTFEKALHTIKSTSAKHRLILAYVDKGK